MLVGGIVFLALYEYVDLMRWGNKGIQAVLVPFLGLGLAGAAAFHPAWIAPAVTAAVTLCVLREVFSGERSLERAALSAFGVLFVAWGLIHLILLRDLRPQGREWTFFLFIVIWSADVAAQLAGSALGKRPLSSASPRKTWEGAVAGVAAAAGAGWFFPLPHGPAWGAGIGVMGMLSDLAESVVKRSVGAKDSSSLLPGHGGILDRFDSFLLTAPWLYYVLKMSQ